jgi:hypothetical protein
LSLKGSHSSHEAKVTENTLKIKVSRVINNVKKSEATNVMPKAVIPPRPRSGCGSFKSKRKSGSKPSTAVGNFFISQNKQALFLNEDDVETYITYPPKNGLEGSASKQ